jgi:hypothetical protein
MKRHSEHHIAADFKSRLHKSGDPIGGGVNSQATLGPLEPHTSSPTGIPEPASRLPNGPRDRLLIRGLMETHTSMILLRENN